MLLLAVAALTAAACSGERPFFVEGQAPTTTTTTTVPEVQTATPVRSDCQSITGPGPLQVVIESEVSSNPCVAMAAHQRLEFVNSSTDAVSFAVGTQTISLQPAETAVSEPLGTLVAPGYTAVESDRPIIGLWVVDPLENTVADALMGLNELGPISIGQTPVEVSAALDGAAIANADGACFVTSIDQDPYSPLLTVRDGALTMIEVFSPGQVTRSQVGIGTSEADIVAAYGERVQEQPTPSGNPEEKLLVFTPADEADQQYRLVFEISNGVVTSMRNGLTEVALAGTGCA